MAKGIAVIQEVKARQLRLARALSKGVFRHSELLNMHFLRKFTLVISILFCASLALAAAAMAAGGGGLGPGDYVFENTTAAAQFGFPNDPNQTSGFDVWVSKGLNSFERDNHDGQNPVVTDSTIVNLQVFGTKGSGYFCFVLNNQGDFKVSRNLKSASLHTNLTADEMCKIGAPVTGKAAGVTPFAGGGGPGLQPPFQVDITWTGTGVTGSGKDRNSFKCGTFSTEATTVTKTAGETATGTISALGGSFASSTAGIISNNTQLNIKGSPVQGCFGF